MTYSIMQQIDQQRQGLVIHQGQTKLIQIGNQFYQLSEIQAQPLAVNPAPAPYQPSPTPIYPQPTSHNSQPTGWLGIPEWVWICSLGGCFVLLTGFGTYLIFKAALAPGAYVPPPAPAPSPAPVIIQQAPPPPPPLPYERTNCRPAGLFGGAVCSTEKGFVR